MKIAAAATSETTNAMRAGHLHGERTEPHVEEEHDRPAERMNALVDARGSQVHRARSYMRGSGPKNSPSRWRFRPLDPLTVRFRVEPAS